MLGVWAALLGSKPTPAPTQRQPRQLLTDKSTSFGILDPSRDIVIYCVLEIFDALFKFVKLHRQANVVYVNLSEYA
jgi:hypothetical protein